MSVKTKSQKHLEFPLVPFTPSERQREIEAWLMKHGHYQIDPVRVGIGEETWEGCSYKSVGHYTKDMPAVQDGSHKDGEKYFQSSFYLLGKLPKSFKPMRENKVCFPWRGSDWYVGGYMHDVAKIKNYAEYHPWGISFTLRCWDVSPGIDHYEPKPYTRIPMEVVYVS